MKIYIRSTGNISPQPTFGHPSLLASPVRTTGNRLTCIEPDYKQFIDPKLIRRMSRIIKMGVAAAAECLNEAGVSSPDAIITGTAYGCLEDSVSFLSRMVEFNEELLTPTAFIQSTHNTVAAQIALMLHCHAYNNTFVHCGFSFESALMDALLLIKEGEANKVLVGGVDEITDASHTILTRLGLYRRGAQAGEGAAFFLLANEPSGNDYAVLDGMTTLYRPKTAADIEREVQSFVAAQGISMQDIDLIITGQNGDAKDDAVYQQLNESVFKDIPAIGYKQFCGEYPTAVSFALWLATYILKTGTLPESVERKPGIKKVLIYNHYQGIHHSLLLVSKP